MERPPLLKWNEWQQWRRDVGRRPTAAADRSTTTTQESAFYKSVMLEVHGEDWAVQLAMLELDQPVEESGTPVPEEFGDRPSGASRGEQSPDGVRSPIPVRPAIRAFRLPRKRAL